jgi:hypothetical protein
MSKKEEAAVKMEDEVRQMAVSIVKLAHDRNPQHFIAALGLAAGMLIKQCWPRGIWLAVVDGLCTNIRKVTFDE